MDPVKPSQAKRPISSLQKLAAQGGEITLAKGEGSIAKLVAIPNEPRWPGRLKGKIRMADDFDAPLLESIPKGFRGED